MNQISKKQQALYDRANFVLNQATNIDEYGTDGIIIKTNLGTNEIRSLTKEFDCSFLDLSDGGLVIA